MQAITASEPIPGYRIRERIGAGGYGEVWCADAPGGLVKAIKFVYGFLAEDRASRELKALNRIKSVRHPFLLSLERIEVVDGQLLIVTELADGSLKDCFDAHQKEDRCGIPWEELIRYMRDAADVLDYMSEEHSLQHLDIKPENILLLADRVKVADFGLVKDIHEATASMMGGLTPLYAPPEVFDGRPSRWSDQYSLAIVYQEMLTGELPFPGTTAIQLARQHLNARPRLAALPVRDQEVIARALSKSPQDRFNSCSELVDALQRAAAGESTSVAMGGRAAPSTGQGNRQGGGAQQQHHTEVLNDVSPPSVWSDASSVSIPQICGAPQVRDLAPLDIESEALSGEPTLFLGVGRSAGRILLRLRNRLADRFGNVDTLPSLQMMLIDTDTKSLMEVSHRQDGLKSHELLGVPLRRPQDYRTDSKDLLQWLSRRWLYNIPRSLKTEGLRPLGRLAFVDHAEQIINRIRTAIQTATAPESLAQSQQQAGMEFAAERMRVVVVASTSGGTGGGMVVDLGYLARHLLGQLGFPDNQVSAVLTHSTGRNPRFSELALVNTYATLSELNHFSRLGSKYPGEKACDLPPRREDNLAFRDTYLVDLGDGLSDEQWEAAIEKVGDYLYLDAATSANHFLRACRDAEPRHADTRNAEIPLRSFGLHQYTYMQDDVISIAIEHLCQHAVEQWVAGTANGLEQPVLKRDNATISRHADGTQEPVYSHLRAPLEKLATSLALDLDSLIQQVSQMMEIDLGQAADTFSREVLERHAPEKQLGESAGIATACSSVTRCMDQLLGCHQDDEETKRSRAGTLENALAVRRRRYALESSKTIRKWLIQQVEDSGNRVRGAQWAAQWIASQCLNVEQALQKLQGNICRELSVVQQSLQALQNVRGRGKDRERSARALAGLEQYIRLRLYEGVASSAICIIHVVKGQVANTQDELMDLERELRHLADQFDTSRAVDEPWGELEGPSNDLMQSVAQVICDNVERLTSGLAVQLEKELLQDSGGLGAMLLQGGRERNALPIVMRGIARTSIIGVMKQLDVSDILFHDDDDDDDDAQSEVDTLAECVQNARPRLIACGGAKRLLVMLPKGSSQVRPIEILHQQLGETPSVVGNCDGDFILCYEAEQISLTQAAVTIIDGRRDLADAASRLHTRNDIEWSSLPDLV